MTPSDRELLALFELMQVPGVGDIGRRRLLDQHRGPLEALAAACAAAQWPADKRGRAADRARVALGAVQAEGMRVLRCDAEGYPRRLKHLTDPPPVLFVRGDTSLLEQPMVAVVGSRDHSEYGASAAQHLAAGLARAGFVVVSGVARGIDGIGHEAALDAGGPSVGVLGCGLDVIYPTRHEPLYRRLIEHGCLISEFLPGEAPLPHHFPQRNRIIAALAWGVVVVEAAAKSGALSTARSALELGREVFAVPGPIGRNTSEGVHGLLRSGATLVASAADVLEAMPAYLMPSLERARARRTARKGAGAPSAGPHGALWAALAEGPAHVDSVASACGVPSASALVGLLELELDGRVQQLPGMRFRRVC